MIKGSAFYKPILEKLNIEELNPMQIQMWETAQKDQDIILQSPTGTGKTLAFLLPLISKINLKKEKVQSLIIAPTRELAMQIYSVSKNMGTGIRFALCYGGHSMKAERNELTKYPQVVIGTPGRLHHHLRREDLILDDLSVLVFDEWDKSLELGFQEDIKDIIRQARTVNQYILTSATGSIKVPDYITLSDPKRLDYISNDADDERLMLFNVISPEKDKIDTLIGLLSNLGTTSTLVFFNYRGAVERTHKLLKDNGIVSEYFHGGLDQIERELKLLKFRNGSVRILVTTDLSARGLDIPLVQNVVHYQLPTTEDQFIHRNGRTARMTATGNAYILTSEGEEAREYLPPSILEYEIVDCPQPDSPPFITLQLSKGKKDKINKVDILGYLTKSCGLRGEDVGLIEIKPYKSYVAVIRSAKKQIIKTSKDKKLKGKTVKVIEI